METAQGAEILARLGADVPVFTAPDSVLVNLTGFHLTRGMLCCHAPPGAAAGGSALPGPRGASRCSKT